MAKSKKLQNVFDWCFERLIDIEQGLSMDENDPGNWTGGRRGAGELKGTKYGISAAAYPNENIEELTLDRAKELYKRDYWDRLLLDRVAEVDTPLVEELFDTAVNMGVRRAVMFLQRSLTVMNLRGAVFPDLIEDGIMGDKTLSALESFVQYRGDEGLIVLVRALNCLQGAQYVQLAVRREKDEKYVYGWLLKRVKV